MKVKSIKVYQAVKMGKFSENVFPNQKIREQDLKMELVAGMGVMLRTSDETILVPFPNISAVNIEHAEESKAAKK